MKDKSIIMLLGWFIVYIICVGIGCVSNYQYSKTNMMNLVDSELKLASDSFNNLINKNLNENPIKHLFLIKEDKNSNLQKNWILNESKFNHEIYNTKNFNNTIKNVFASNKPHFSEYTIQKIPTRISITSINQDLENQILLVSMKPINYIYETINSNLKRLFTIFIIFSVILFPIMVYILNINKKYWLSKIKDSNTDSLTGIPNHLQLILNLENTTSPNLAFIKILNYNSFIIEYGPAITDSITKQFVTVLSGFEDPRLQNPSIYRVQQSTFAILEDQDISLAGISDITGKIIKSLLTYDYMVGDDEFIKLKVTVGACKQKKDAYTLANMALSEALEKHLPYYFIDSGEKHLPKTYKKDLKNIKKIKLAIDEDRLVPFFQPIFNAKTLKVEKYESLARIVDSNNLPILFPNKFLPLVNREKLSYKITRIILKKSISFARTNNIKVSINLGVHDINNEQTCNYIYTSIKNSNINHLLQFEILENEAIVESENVLIFIKNIQKLGCQIGMDDLGKGYSNFERLINLPVDFVKIDRCIMEHLADSLEVQNLTKGIIRLAHKKNIKVTAEYCKNKSITDMAIMLGADLLQGHYFSQANPEIFTYPKENSQNVINT